MENVGFTTITAPNGPSCLSGTEAGGDGVNCIMAASSHHPGGAQVVLLDGKVTFVSENIDTGDLSVAGTIGGMSPHGVWGALGTKAGGDRARAP